ncbi:hypothetical protein [Herbaspirillum sp. SJZ107]|uniref:hypothetical protein n=1 Tax=Herbaspirillum sp. SJZ107 TaxID=2572881 RepID=UPI00114DBB31|nr:hypothetical protein [Herbaspirillum sp. SJZ107]TQK05066.1 hypothetical protein FBX97_4031 [Herbaspirillum sp. SJZ107]
MTLRAAILSAAAGLAATACGPAAQAAEPDMGRLMAQAFPGWDDSAAGHVRTVTVPHLPGVTDVRGANWETGAQRVLAAPELVLRTDATHLTLVAGLVPAGADGKPAAAHTVPRALAAYQFARRGGAWTLAASQGIFALRGFFGEASLHRVALSGQRQGVAVEYGSCWGGYCGTWLALYELQGPTVQGTPVVEMALSGTNVNAALDCARRLQPLVKAPPQDSGLHDSGTPPDNHDCYTIDGNWQVDPARAQPGDLVVHYHGAISRAEAHAAAPAAIDQRQVLRYQGGRYRAVAGFNPVPPI